MIIEIDSLIIRIEIPETQVLNKYLLKKDEEVLEPLYNKSNKKAEKITNFNKRENYELVKALKAVLPTPSLIDIESTFYIQLLIKPLYTRRV